MHQAPIDGRARRYVVELLAQLGQDRPWPPGWMHGPHRDDPGLDDGRQLVWTAVGLGAFLGQGPDPLVGIAHEPPVEGAPVHPVARGHIGDRGSGVEHLPHGELALLKHRKVHQRHDRLLGSGAVKPR